MYGQMAAAPVVEGLEGIGQAGVTSDGAGPDRGTVHDVSIAEAANKHHTCSITTCHCTVTHSGLHP